MPDTLLSFEPSRAAALDRLARFVPAAGQKYAAGRNIDAGSEAPSAVSRLSPYLRYRLLTEPEVVRAVLNQHNLMAAEKYVQEVLWRTYWKGWLEMRPSVWHSFVDERDRAQQSFPNARALAAAENGTTGIEGFDDWARELIATGYLHNHARMWFASIWIFTLRLPWALGADFFLRHLLDADAASNTLSWRWVAGLQTAGKTYLATADNIARYTNGRFAPTGLASNAAALTEPAVAAARPLPRLDPVMPGTASLLLVTPEDLHPQASLFTGIAIKAAVITAGADLLWGDQARSFVASAASDTSERTAATWNCPAQVTATLDPAAIIAAAQAAEVRQIVAAYAPVGPVADALGTLAPALAAHGIALTQVRRRWDEQFWPHAKKGFFAFKERIPELLREIGI